MVNKLNRKINDIKYRFSLLEKKQKSIYAWICGIFAVLVLALGIAVLTSTYSVVKIKVSDFNSNLSGLNRSGKSGSIKNNGQAFFKFNENQRKQIEDFYKNNTTAALKIRLQISPTKNQFENTSEMAELPFMFGFLESNDFTSHGRLNFNRVGHVTVKGDLAQIFKILKEHFLEGNSKPTFVFDLSFAIPKNSVLKEDDNIPLGFYIDSWLGCKVLSSEIVTATLGFDFSSDINFYGFSSNGGKLDFLSQSADFSGAAQIFSLNFAKDVIPNIIVKFVPDIVKSSLKEGNVYVGLNIGGEKFKIKCIENLDEIKIPAAGISSPYSFIELYKHKDFVTSILMETGDVSLRPTDNSKVLKPIKTDPGLILDWNTKNWRNKDYEVYNWDRFPEILFFDIRDLRTQEKFFSRLAFFVEKEGYKGRILSNEELEGKHGYNAHDYSAESMASFFNKAQSINFKLNPEEETLKSILIENGMLVQDSEKEGFVKAVKGGLVSISKETPAWSRKRLLAHEGWHTLYFADEEFRNFVAACYYTMESDARDFIVGFFRSQPSLGYDVNDDYLMKNEFMAYVLQQPLNQVVSYFTGLAGWPSVVKAQPDLCRYVKGTEARAFEDVAIMMNEYLFTKWGIESGNISLISME